MDKEIIIYNKDVLKDMKREIAEELQALYRLFFALQCFSVRRSLGLQTR